MPRLSNAARAVLSAQLSSGKPLAIILAGHNGSGKSTMWYQKLANRLQIPLINADRMMLSILPEPNLPPWARRLRDSDEGWMKVAQGGVQTFVANAMSAKVPFAMETVFSYWKKQEDGSYSSKLNLIEDLQREGYFVLLLFVGLTNSALSAARVSTRIAQGGHAVPPAKLSARFPRTQAAIRAALPIADAAILVDNSREPKHAFSVCRIQIKENEIYDRRNAKRRTPPEILNWLNAVSPR